MSENASNSTADKSDGTRRKILHIASAGCQGSSYTAFELDRHPKNKIFYEPFNPYFTGRYRKPMYSGLINCFFLNQCNESKQFHLHRLQRSDIPIPPSKRKRTAHSVLLNYLNNFEIWLGFKTVQFTRFDLIHEYALSQHPQIASDYYILLLVRDPRGTWNSCKKFEAWAESDPSQLCSKYMDMVHEMQSLIAKHPHIHVMAIYYEYMSFLYPNEYRALMYKFFGLSPNVSVQTDSESIAKEIEKYGNKSAKLEYANRWFQELNFSQIELVQNIESCSDWIDMFGYKEVDQTAYDTRSFEFLTVPEMQTIVNPYPMYGH